MRLSFPPLKSRLVLGMVVCMAAASAWAAAATQLAFTTVPAILYSGANAGTVKVTIEAANGGKVTTSTATVTLTLTGPNGFAHTVSAAAKAGVASLNAGAWPLAAGAYTLTASASGLTSATATVTVLAASTVLPSTAVGRSAAPVDITFGFAAAATVTGVQVLYQGAPNLDFTQAGASDCVGSMAAGATCTVAVTFSPRAMGSRRGAVELLGADGILQTLFLSGVGLGQGANFSPSAQASIGTNLGYPDAMAFDGNGNLYIAAYPSDGSAGSVVRIPVVNGVPNSAAQTTFGTNLNYADGLAFDGAGDLFVSDYDENELIEVPANAPADGSGNIVILQGDGTPTGAVNNPAGVAVDGAGNLFVADYSNNRVLEIPAQNGQWNGASAITVGTGLGAPSGLRVDASGNLLIADFGNSRVVEIPNQNGALNSAAQVTLLSDTVGAPADVALDAAGNLYVALEYGNSVEVVPNQNGTYNPADAYTVATGLNNPDSVAVDDAGNIYYCDTYNGLAYRLDTVDPPALNFPSTGVGQLSPPQTVPLLNIGNQPLSINSLQFGAAFPNQGSTCTGTLPAGGSCQIVTAFAPTALGGVNQEATLSDNAVNQPLSPQSISMSGTGQPGAQVITFTLPATAEYGAGPIALSAAGGASQNPVILTVQSGPGAIHGAQLSLTGAGTIVVAANQAGDAQYLAAPQVTAAIRVDPAILTVTPRPVSMAFGSAVPALSGYTISGFVNGDTAGVVTGAPALSTAVTSTTGVGTYPITAAYGTLSAANYNFLFAPGTMTITAAPAPASWTPATTSLVYGASLAGLLNATQTVAGTWTYSSGQTPLTTATRLPAGSYVATAVFTPQDALDYSAVTLTQAFRITPAPLTVTANNVSAPYAAIPALTAYTVSGLAVGETASVITGTPVLTTTATNASTVGTYPINVTTAGMSAANYSFVGVPAVLTITPAIPSTSWVPAISPNLPYGTSFAGLMTATSPVPGTWSYSMIGSPQFPTTVPGPGSSVLTAFFQPTDSVDYQTVTLNLPFSVSATVLTVSALNQTMTYGGALPALTYSITGWRPGDGLGSLLGVPLLTTTATSLSPVGTYPISVSVVGLSAPNYGFTAVAGTLTIIPATPAVSLSGAAGGSVIYGTALGSALAANSSVPGTWSFTANGAPVTAASVLAAGTYTITGTFTPSSANYSSVVQTLPGTLTVAPAVLTVTAADATMTTGGALPTFGYSITGFVGSDTQASAVSGAPEESTTASSSSPAGTYPITVSAGSLAAANYTFTFVNGTLTVQAGTALPYTASIRSTHDFKLRPIHRGGTLWLSADFDAQGVQDGTVLSFQSGTVTFQAGGQTIQAAVPNATITFLASATGASTHFDVPTQTWITTAPVPARGYGRSWWGDTPWGGNWGDCGWGNGAGCNLFLSGVAMPVPAGGGRSNRVEDATWSGTLSTNNSSLLIKWGWQSDEFSQFGTDYNALGVLAAATPQSFRGQQDGAGTPENFERFEVPGAQRGGFDWDDGPAFGVVNFNPSQSGQANQPPPDLLALLLGFFGRG